MATSDPTRIYTRLTDATLGEVVHRGKVNPGEHAAILEPALFAAVQERLTEQHHGFVRARAGSQALLLGRLFDDRANRMSPTHANKQGVRYRYYVSCALAQGRPEAVGSVARVAAAQVEHLVLRILREQRPDLDGHQDRELIEQCVDHVVIDSDTMAMTLRGGASDSEHVQRDSAHVEASAETAVAKSVLRIPWAPIHSRRRREVILPAQAEVPDQRPIRAETRATLVRAIALGRRWLDELAAGSIPNPAAIASREGCSQRHVERTISLAFLAPDLVQAAIEGRLPRGVGVSRLITCRPSGGGNGGCSACRSSLCNRCNDCPSGQDLKPNPAADRGSRRLSGVGGRNGCARHGPHKPR